MNYKINYFSEGVHSISYQNRQVTKLTDSKNTLLYTYDAKRRVTNVNVNGDSYVSMAYTDSATENGKRVDKVTATYIARASGVQDSFTQVSDKFGNTLRVEYNGNTLMEGSYHADSRPDQLIDHVSGETEQYHYTGSKLESVTRSKDGAEVYREEYSYNEYGDITEVSRTCNTHTENYTYQYADTAARELVKVTSATNGSSGIGSKIYYDDLGRAEAYALSGLGNKEFAKEQYSYKLSSGRAGGYVSQIHYFKTLTAGTLIEDGSLQYCYDSAGNISLVKNGNGDQLARYKYDNANRLEREDNWQLGRSYYIEYDRYGNITVKKEGAAAQNNISYDTTKSYTYDAAGRLINYNGEGFAYDGMGNPTTYRNKAVVWEKGRQMKSFNGIAFEYDGRGRRIKKGNVTYIYDASGNLISSSDGLRYLYGVNGIYAVEDNDRSYYFRKDAQGNIIALLDGAGGVVVQYVYDAWGNHAVLDSNGNDLTDSSHIGNRNPIRYRGYFYE